MTPPTPQAKPAVSVKPDVLYEVSPNGSVMGRDHQVYGPGTKLTREFMQLHGIDKKWLEDQERAGFVQPVGHKLLVGLDGQPLNDPRRQPGPTVGGERGGSVVGGSTPTLRTNANPSAPGSIAPSTPVSVWDKNPADLQPLTLAALNVMIHETNPDSPTFETKEEAIAFLSADYKPPAPAPKK